MRLQPLTMVMNQVKIQISTSLRPHWLREFERYWAFGSHQFSEERQMSVLNCTQQKKKNLPTEHNNPNQFLHIGL